MLFPGKVQVPLDIEYECTLTSTLTYFFWQMLNMMCVFKDSPSVQEQGCWFLKVMSAQSTVFCLKVKSCNAEAVISSTLHRHAQVPRVVAYAQMCLVVLEAAGPATPQDYTPPGSPIKIPGMGDTSKNKKWNFLGRK